MFLKYPHYGKFNIQILFDILDILANVNEAYISYKKTQTLYGFFGWQINGNMLRIIAEKLKICNMWDTTIINNLKKELVGYYDKGFNVIRWNLAETKLDNPRYW